MASSVSLHLDIQNSLLKTLQQTQVSMRQFNDSLATSGKLTRTVNDHYDEIEDSSEKIVKSSKAWNSVLDKTRELANYIATPFITIFSIAKIVDTTKAMLQHNTELTKMSYRMGELGQTTGELTTAMYATAKATGVSTDQAIQMITTLRELRVPTKLMQDMATTAIKFSEVTGMAAESTAQLAGNLMRVGRLGAAATKEIMTTMAAVQREVGLARSDMEALNESIIEFTQYLSQLGKSAEQIKAFNQGVTQLAGAFTQVGLKAGDALEVMDRLLDPGRIEDNALLIAKLGMSIEDIITGDIGIEQVTAGMKDLGQEITNMSGPAAAALAQSMGVSLKQLRAMANLETDLAKGAGDINEMWKEQLTPQERMAKTMERISTLMEGVLAKMMPAFEFIAGAMEKVFGFIQGAFGGGGGAMKGGLMVAGVIGAIFALSRLRKRFFAMNTEVAQHQEKAMTEALVMAHRKAAIVSSRQAPGPRRAGVAARIQAGPAFQAMQAEADRFGAMAEVSLVGPVRQLVEHTEDWLRSISMGTRPIGRINILTEQLRKKARERVELSEQERAIQMGIVQGQRETLQQQLGIYQARMNELEVIKDRGAEQEWELKRLAKKSEIMTTKIDKFAQRESDIAGRYNNLRESYLRKLAPEERFNMVEQLKNQAQILERTQMKAKEDLSSSRTQREILEMQRRVVRAEDDRLAAVIKSGKANTEQVSRYNEIHKQLLDINNQQDITTKSIREQEQVLDKTREQHVKINKEIERIGAAGRVERAPVLASFPRQMLNVAKAIGNNIGGRAVDAARRIRNSAEAFGKSVVQRLNPVNWWRGIRARMRGFGDNEGRRTRGVMSKMLGPLGLLLGVFLAMKPVQALIQKVMAAIKPILSQVAEALMPIVSQLMPIFIKLFQALLPLVVTLINVLMPPLLKILGAAVMVIGKLVQTVGKLIMFMMELPIHIGAAFKAENQRAAYVRERMETLQQGSVYKAAATISDFGQSIIEAGEGLWKMKWTPVQLGAGAGAGGVGAGGPALVKTIAGRPTITGTVPGVQTPEEVTAEGVGNVEINTGEISENTSALPEIRDMLKERMEGMVGGYEAKAEARAAARNATQNVMERALESAGIKGIPGTQTGPVGIPGLP